MASLASCWAAAARRRQRAAPTAPQPAAGPARRGPAGASAERAQPRLLRARRREAPPERDLDQPEVCRLPREGGPVHRPQAGEELREVAAEVGVQRLVGVEAEELADGLDGEDL